MKILKSILTILILGLLVGIAVLAYFGFVPGLSKVLGATHPGDLGVKYTQAEYDSFGSKLNGDTTPITADVEPKDSISYDGKIDVNKDFSQEEVSSRLNNGHWKYMPIDNVQLRVNDDGSVEFSANVIMDRLPGFVSYAGMGRYTMADVEKGLDFIKMIKVNPPVYMKFRASVTENDLDGSIESAQVGKFDVPLGEVDADGVAESVFEAITERAPTFYAKSVTFTNGKMHFEGTLPAKMMVETE